MVKKARLWLVLYFVKLWTVIQFLCYVKEKSCNKTNFELFNTV